MKKFTRTSVSTKLLQKESTLKRIVGSAFLEVVKDFVPDIVWVFVTRVELTPDLALLRIFLYSSSQDHDKAFVEDLIKKLVPTIPLLRKYIAQHAMLRRVPKLFFLYDSVCEKSLHIEALIDAADKEYKD